MVTRPARRSAKPKAISVAAAATTIQSGNPVKGSTPEPTDSMAPRTPPAGAELPPEAVTPRTPPAELPWVVAPAFDDGVFVTDVLFVAPERPAPVVPLIVPPPCEQVVE